MDIIGIMKWVDAYQMMNHKIGSVKVEPDADSAAQDVEVAFTSTVRSMIFSFFERDWDKSRANLDELKTLTRKFEAALDNIEEQLGRDNFN